MEPTRTDLSNFEAAGSRFDSCQARQTKIAAIDLGVHVAVHRVPEGLKGNQRPLNPRDMHTPAGWQIKVSGGGEAHGQEGRASAGAAPDRRELAQ